MDIGSAVGRETGITEQQLQELPRHREGATFSPIERLVLDLAEHLTQTAVPVPVRLMSELREHFSESQLVELVATIAWENHRARFNRAFGIRAVGFSEGAYCVLPVR